MVSCSLFPREAELEVVWNAGHQKTAIQEFEACLQLHPDNCKIQILHDRTRVRIGHSGKNNSSPIYDQQTR
jgi:hypothetical protein